ncbi:right-handed parallel beta-helix repeat-containing protein, partial [Pseudonocardia nigra]|uniref:right-handed parallel beta-helix repeat-containing protein n=1 Tax=Pseudonocardia nigra TaxID=1921578 RepID=UPI001C5FDBC8
QTGVAGRLLAAAGDPTDAAPALPPSPEVLPAATAAEQQQALLVEAEDERLLSIVTEPPPPTPREVGAEGAVPTVVLTARPEPYDLGSLERLGAAERLPDGSWLLSRSVVVMDGAQLRIQEPGGTLRLASGPGGFTSVIAFKGMLTLSGGPDAPLTVTSWNPEAGTADTEIVDGRAYIRAAAGARMELSQLAVTDLGFWSGRTGGLAWTGSSSRTAGGSAAATTVQRSHFGMFLSSAADVTVTDTTLRDNAVDGLLLHRETTGFVGERVTSTGNGRHGVAVSPSAERVTLTEVTAAGNAVNGIRIDGSPLADGPTAGGASTARGAGYTVERSTVRDNAEEGIVAVETGELVLRSNTVGGNRDGIVLRGPAAAPVVTDNSVDAAEFGIAVRDGVRDADVSGNRVGTAVIAIQVADASARVERNEVAAATRYGVSLVGEVTGSSVVDNALAGRGLAAVDLNRVGLTATVLVNGNDETGWTVDVDDVQYWMNYVADHPLVLLWLLILVPPIAIRLWTTRRHRGDGELQHPYRDVALGPAVGSDSTATQMIPTVRRARAQARPASPAGAAPGDPPVAPADRTVALPVTRVTVVSRKGARR